VVNPWEDIGRLLIVGGIFLLVAGLAIFMLGRSGMTWHLPGDIFINKGNFSIFFPLATCILISIVLTIILNTIGRR